MLPLTIVTEHCLSTESLGDGLERVVSDEAHEETRRRIRSAAPSGHLAAGFRGLGLGILGTGRYCLLYWYRLTD